MGKNYGKSQRGYHFTLEYVFFVLVDRELHPIPILLGTFCGKYET